MGSALDKEQFEWRVEMLAVLRAILHETKKDKRGWLSRLLGL